MHYIGLEEITEDHLVGVWEVFERVQPKYENNRFQHSKRLELNKGFYRVTNGQEIKGRWTVKRELELIYNPQIEFSIGSETIEEAIITRLFYETENNTNIHRMTIYFTNGLELMLFKVGL